MKRLWLAILCLICVSEVFAQNWTRSTEKEFRKAKEISFEVNMANAEIMGVSRDKFPIYYAGKYQQSEEQANLMLERFANEIKLEFFKKEAPKVTCVDNAKFKVIYVIQTITEKAGFTGSYYVECNGDKSAEYNFSIKDGRWNEFETLLAENVVKLFKINKDAVGYGGYQGGNSPYQQLLFNYKK